MNHLILLHILITFLLLSTLSACGSGSTNGRQTGRQVSITGAAQKGDFIKDSQISFARFFRSGASSTERLDSSILNNKGEYAVSLTWNDWTKITTTGVFYNEFLGEESTVALTLNSITDIGGSSEAFKINFFTHFAAARIEYLINQGQTLSSASQQALSEIKTSFSLSGNSIETIDLNQDSHSDNAILLLFSASFLAVNQQNMFATSLEILTLDFTDNGLFDGASKALFQKISNYAGKKNVFFPLYNNLRKRGYTNPPNQNTIKISPSWINNNPSVSIEGAELGKIIIFGESVTLRGTGVDTDGQIKNYLWSEGNISKGTDSELKLSSLSVGEHYLTLTVTDNEGASSSAFIRVTVNSERNKAPLVYAGSDQTISFGQRVILSGTTSDSDGSISSWIWKEGSVTKNSGATSTIPSLAINNLPIDIHQFTLSATDNQGITSTDHVIVTVKPALNTHPIANAGADQTINFGQSVTLNGSSNGSISSWIWNEGTVIKRSGNSSNIPSLILDQLSVGLHEFTLSVTSNNNITSTDYVRVLVNPVPLTNTPPIVKAGPDQSINFGQSVSLNGSAHDTDGSISSWAWKEGKVIKASGKSSVISSLKINSLSVGLHEFTLSATDNKNSTSTDYVRVLVNPVPVTNTPPIVKAGPDQSISFGQSVSLNGSAHDTDGSISSWVWKEGKIIKASGKSSVIPSLKINKLSIGLHEFTLSATDNKNATSTDKMEITVKGSGNKQLTAKAGTDRTITELQAITLTGEGNVSDGSITSYTWKEGAIKLSKTQKLSLKNLTPGTHHLTLVVTDNSEATASDNVTITVTALRVNLVGQKACTTRAFFGSTYHIGANYTLSGGKNGSGIAKLNQYSDASCTKNPSHFFNFAQSAPANYFIQSISASGTSGRMSVTSQGQTSTRSIVVANGNVTKIN